MANHRGRGRGGDVVSSGPIELFFGGESPIKPGEVARYISLARKRRRNQAQPLSLSLLGCEFRGGTGRAFRVLGDKLRRGTHLRELAVCGVGGVGNKELSSLAPFLNANTTLRSLNLTGAAFDASAVEAIRPFFRRCASLEVLVLGENPSVGDDGAEAVASSLHGGELRVLSVDSCGLGRRGASAISKFMMHGGSALRVLDLSNNDIGDSGGECLAHSIGWGHGLGELALNNAGVGDRTATALEQGLRHNRSLHTLSLRNNTGITSFGTASLVKAVYNTDSIRELAGCNHTLRSLDLNGCCNVERDVLSLSAQLPGRIRLGSVDEVIRWKVSAHLKNANCGVALQDFDIELMPRLIAFVGRSSGATGLFQTLKSMPILYTQYDPSRTKSLDPAEEETEAEANNAAAFLGQLKLSSRRARKYYAIFSNFIPRRSSLLRYQDRRIRSKRESRLASALNNNQKSHLSAAMGSFVQLKSYYNVLKQALLLWLFHTRYVVKVSARARPRHSWLSAHALSCPWRVPQAL